jgi:NADH:ubiquinone oxidoreductase subunit F (NADH-binding)
MNSDTLTACNCVRCTTARLKALGSPVKEAINSEEENLLNKICDEIEAECFCDTGEYSREKMKKRLLPHLIS